MFQLCIFLFSCLCVWEVLAITVRNRFDNNGDFLASHAHAKFGPGSSKYSVEGTPVQPLDEKQCVGMNDIQDTPLYMNRIVVISRGGCSFIEKVATAQKMGAIGVIIGNISENQLAMDATSSKEEDDIHIHAVLIGLSSYILLKKAIQQDNAVKLHSQYAENPHILVNIDHTTQVNPNSLYIARVKYLAISGLAILVIIMLFIFSKIFLRAWRSKVVRHQTVDIGKTQPLCVYLDNFDFTKLPNNIGYITALPSEASSPKESYASIEHSTDEDEASTHMLTSANTLSNVPILHITNADLLNILVQQHRNGFISCSPVLPKYVQVEGKIHPCYQSVGNTCTICFEEYKSGDIVKVLPCKHVYHPECIDQWLHSGPQQNTPDLQYEYDDSYNMDIELPNIQTTNHSHSGVQVASGAHTCPVCKASILGGMEKNRWDKAPWWVKLYRTICKCEVCTRTVRAR